MNSRDLNELRSEFEALQSRNNSLECVDGSCISDEESREDYPDYLRAIYAEIMPPAKSGIYFSRWDLKKMAMGLDESFAIDDMLKVIEQFSNLIDMKCELYKEYSQKYPSTKEIFDEKIHKADNAKKYLHKVYVEFFT